ncbi:MAG: hypothetical protein M3N48_06245 [Verrucomicrobiota bacterium]|nr:hypothetical protein [Verrucomicrobiota bacterium]
MARASIRDLPSGVNCYADVNGRGEKSWIISLGTRFTGSSRRIRKSFPTASKAREWFHGEGQAHRAHRETPIALKAKAGAAGFELSGRHIADAAAAIRLLDGRGTLSESAAFFLQKAKPSKGERTVSAIIAAVNASKLEAGRSKRHLKGLRINLARFEKAFGDQKAHEVSSDAIESWLNQEGFKGTTRKNYLRDLNILFRFAFRRGWTVGDPLAGIERPTEKHEEKTILEPDDIAEFLNIAEQVAPEIVVALAVKFFAGLRTSELFLLEWSDISQGLILIKAGHAKTRQRRSVTVSPNLQKWLNRYRSHGGLTSRRDNQWHRDIEKIEVYVNGARQFGGRDDVFALPANGARDCFCSYHFAFHQNENLTAAEAGNSPAVIFRNYRQLVSKQKAEAFWKIEPKR